MRTLLSTLATFAALYLTAAFISGSLIIAQTGRVYIMVLTFFCFIGYVTYNNLDK